MDRRTNIKHLLTAGAAVITLPQWMISCGISDTDTHHSSFSAREQRTLSLLVDTLIPAGADATSIGALATGTDKFLQKLLDDCYEQPVRDNVKKQLASLDGKAKKQFDGSFEKIDSSERLQLISSFTASGDKSEREFMELIKTETIRGFITSRQVMQEFLGYKVAPGHYYGSVTINA